MYTGCATIHRRNSMRLMYGTVVGSESRVSKPDIGIGEAFLIHIRGEIVCLGPSVLVLPRGRINHRDIRNAPVVIAFLTLLLLLYPSLLSPLHLLLRVGHSVDQVDRQTNGHPDAESDPCVHC
ncbi:hypothetical protein PMAYCL1PPCAC_05587, partial [Pristionchus mayeri]